jgi:lipoprotein-anchoring transpeptidase ErfK/SrfK
MASHGCVRMGIGAAKEMYEWAPVGTRVIIEK